MPVPATTSELPLDGFRRTFEQRYGNTPRVFRAPGRVNLIGEHTDYNDGFVMPAAIQFHTWVAVGKRPDAILHVESEQFQEAVEWPLSGLSGPPRQHWSDYIRGVAAVLQTAGFPLTGANLMIQGEVPLGAGLSSSAALEVSTALALLSTTGRRIPPRDLAELCQRAEHEYSGTRCGIMDQFIAVHGQVNQAVMLDCRTLEFTLLPLPDSARLVICNSMVRHELAAGEYNLRRADCETGVRVLRHHLPSVHALRDIALPDLEVHKNEVSETVYYRCRHVITENQRVVDAASALQGGELKKFGELMYDSHRSLREDYEVSCEELDLLVDIAGNLDGVYGARMTGGGFGGCTINLVQSEKASEVSRSLAATYKDKTGKTPEVYVCSAADGAREWTS